MHADPVDEWLVAIQDTKKENFGKPSTLTKKGFAEMCNAAQKASSSKMEGAELGFCDRLDAAEDIILEFLYDAFEAKPSWWARLKYKAKGFAAGAIWDDEYKDDYLSFRGNIGMVKSDLARLKVRVSGRKLAAGQIYLNDKDVMDTVLMLLVTVANDEDLLRMSAAPIDAFILNVAPFLAEVATEYPDTWEHGDFGGEINAKKLSQIFAVLALIETQAETVKLAIEANDASTFKVLLILLNIVTFIGSWFYGYVIPEETVCTVEACDTLLEQSLRGCAAEASSNFTNFTATSA